MSENEVCKATFRTSRKGCCEGPGQKGFRALSGFLAAASGQCDDFFIFSTRLYLVPEVAGHHGEILQESEKIQSLELRAAPSPVFEGDCFQLGPSKVC